MTEAIIKIRNLGKCYRLGEFGVGSLREEVEQLGARFFRRGVRKTPTDFWALRNLTVDIGEGEALGIVGQNGAGKSTLLKLLSRITEPSEGEAFVRGRVASLLEVGTGFHPELTGRDNIFLSGTILGMTREEIRKRFDEIVDFAGLAAHIDTPVKRYSSGMYVRLGFSVAAHMDPEILILDEVLAVGDVRFQEKCLRKMRSFRDSGKTILFVSHNPMAIRMLCSRCIILESGNLVGDGAPHEIIARYLEGVRVSEGEVVPKSHPEKACVLLERLRVVQGGEATASPQLEKPFSLIVDYVIREEREHIYPNIHLFAGDGSVLFSTVAWPGAVAEGSDLRACRGSPGRYRAECIIPAHFLNTGRYSMSVLFVNEQALLLSKYDSILSFDVREEITMRKSGFTGTWIGATRPLLEWRVEEEL